MMIAEYRGVWHVGHSSGTPKMTASKRQAGDRRARFTSPHTLSRVGARGAECREDSEYRQTTHEGTMTVVRAPSFPVW